MGLLDKLRGELIDIIEWTESAKSDVLAYRFPRYNNEIKMGAKLVVREGQAGVFVNEGQLADVFRPGTHTLQTQNMPILSTIKGWKYGFNSPFKAEVYFINMKQWTDLKWGTQNPFMMRDPEFGPVRIRAFGTYAMHVSDPGVFLKELVSTDPSLETYEVTNQLRNAIIAKFVDVVGQAHIPILDLAGNYEKMATLARQRIGPDLGAMGLELTAFYIENISLPPEVEKMLDKRTEMGVLGNMDQYTRFQTANAIGDAANNPSGMAGVGAGLGAGYSMANQMASAFQNPSPGAAQAAGAAPPPLPAAAAYHIAVNNQQMGPFDLNLLAGKAREGVLTRTTLVWKQGMAGWVAAETVPDLQPLFAAMPPPLPQ